MIACAYCMTPVCEYKDKGYEKYKLKNELYSANVCSPFFLWKLNMLSSFTTLTPERLNFFNSCYIPIYNL